MAFDKPERLLGWIHGRQAFTSKRRHFYRVARASFDSPCSRERLHGSGNRAEETIGAFRSTENSSEAVAGNIPPIVHTEGAFSPTAQRAAPQRGCLSFGHDVREDDDAPPCLEQRQILKPCRSSCSRARQQRPCAEAIRSGRDRHRD